MCAPTNHPELATKVKTAASEFMARSKRLVADSSERTISTARPFIIKSKTFVAKTSTDTFEYASRAGVKVRDTYRSRAEPPSLYKRSANCPPANASALQQAASAPAEAGCPRLHGAVP
jgi:hypothetical protein